MNYNILPLPPFEKQLKQLCKKYHSLKDEYLTLIESLEENPQQGVNIGNNCFIIRLSIASKGKGKSGGARIITNLIIEENTVYLLSIYDKSNKENITTKELKELLKNIPDSIL